MAYWQRKKVGKYTYVAVYTRKDGRPKPLPRSQVKHLDRESNEHIDKWVAAFDETTEDPTELEHAQAEQTCSRLQRYVNEFIEHYRSRGRFDGTVNEHRRYLNRYVIPYFLSRTPPLHNPNDWPQESVRMQKWLDGNTAVPLSVKGRVNITLRMFYRYLTEEGVVSDSKRLHLRHPTPYDKTTPLAISLEPKMLIELVNGIERKDLRLLALIGYSFSLRPQEIVALRPIDFIAGNSATTLDCCKVMREAGLYDRLAVSVNSQRRGNLLISPKSGSRGIVACFDKELAYRLVREVAGFEPSQLIFQHRIDWYYSLWRKHRSLPITLKDLRRSSLLWLGQYTNLRFVALKNHARHSSPATTALYVRRPEELSVHTDPDDFSLSLD
jgi:hypothetical protein